MSFSPGRDESASINREDVEFVIHTTRPKSKAKGKGQATNSFTSG